jgi:hypothetical protein
MSIEKQEHFFWTQEATPPVSYVIIEERLCLSPPEVMAQKN